MAWTVLLFNLPTETAASRDFPKHFKPPALGTTEEVIQILEELFPNISGWDPSGATLTTSEFSVELSFHLHKRNSHVVEAIGLRVHGFDSVISVIRELCETTGWSAYDTSRGDFIDFATTPAAGLQGWREYAQRVIGPTFRAQGHEIAISDAMKEEQDP